MIPVIHKNKMSDNSLVAFKAIANFINDLNEEFGKAQHSLKLYAHLLNKTTISHEKAINRNIELFRAFCVANRDAITSKSSGELNEHAINYSEKAKVNFRDIFRAADADTKTVIWDHLLTISALVDPAGKAKEILKKSSGGKEGDFLGDIISKVEQHVDPNTTNPMEAVSSILQSGIFTDLVSGMNKGVQDGSLDIAKLMGTVQTMVGSLSDQAGAQEGGDNAMNMISGLMQNMMGSMPKPGDASEDGNDDSAPAGMPDLSGIMSQMGPMLAGLTGSGAGAGSEGIGLPELGGMLAGLSGGGENIAERLDEEYTKAKRSKIRDAEE